MKFLCSYIKNRIELQPYEILVLKKITCNYCEDSKKNKYLAITVFTSLFTIGLIYVVFQRCIL